MEPKREKITSICAALCAGMGIEPPRSAAAANEALTGYLAEKLAGETLDRVVMFNPDGLAEWVMDKYPKLFRHVTGRAELALPLETVMPSVTPVCFASLYTGAEPAVHGIRKYERPVVRTDTVFDALLRAGKKVAILASATCSVGMIFQERDLHYYHLDNVEKINAKAAELILRDEYDFLLVYNGNYDMYMHRNGPESPVALGEADANAHMFGFLYELIRNHWQGHRTLLGFAMDHGCHEIDDGLGSHGLDMPEDLFIRHYYTYLG